MNERRFGVEIECGSDRYTSDNISTVLRRHRLPYRSIGHDGSGIEVRTEPLRGRDGFKLLQEIMQCLVEEGGCYTTARDGMHVHHDAPELVPVRARPQRIQLVRSWHDNQPLIRRFVAPGRPGSGACPLWSAQQVQQYEQGRNDWGRHALNVSALREHGTIELRLHEGTLDFEKAEAWIKFGQYFISNVIQRAKPLAACDDAATLLRRIRAPKAAQLAYA